MIPKIIHYCWFGDTEMPQTFKEYIKAWKKIMPEYELKLWTNNDLPYNIPYIRTAYLNKKWANLSNYIRLYAVYKYGGIYLDTDVEVIKNFNDLLHENCFFGIESQSNTDGIVLNNAVFGAVKNHWFIKQCKDTLLYKFDGCEDANESSPKLITQLYYLRQYKENDINRIKIFPPEYFYPYHFTENFSTTSITKNTYCVHHWSKTWQTSYSINIKYKIYHKLLQYSPKVLKDILLYGYKNWRIISNAIVISGPFKGTKLISKSSCHSSFYPKIFGTYESILHEVIYNFLDCKYSKVINIGCDEGYYAIGMAKLFNIGVDAYDIDSESVGLAKLNVASNGLSNIKIYNQKFEMNYWERYRDQRNLVICDIEGDEIRIFSTEILTLLEKMDFIIELHDFLNPIIKQSMIDLFSKSHLVEVLQEKMPTISERLFKSGNKIFQLIDEKRPVEMEWLILKSKAYWS